MKLYTTSKVANYAADFLMIVASICGVKIEEVVVPAGSPLDKELTKAGFGTYPML